MTLPAAPVQQGDPAACVAFGEGVADKLIAFHGQGGLLARSPENILNLYGMLRLGDINGLYDDFVDRHLAFYAACGPAPDADFPQLAMGGIAGAYRLLQGHYRRGPEGLEGLRLCVRQLLEKMRQNPAGVIGAAPARPDLVSVDALLQVAPFLCMAGEALQDDALFDTAVGLAAEAADLLRDARTGFYHHAGRREGKRWVTPDAWCRGNGCAAAVMVELLPCLPAAHPARAELIERLRDLLERLAAVQTPAGLWRQQLVDESSREELSGSALIGYAIAVALRRGWVSGSLAPAAGRAWSGMQTRVAMRGNWNIADVNVEAKPGDSPDDYAAIRKAVNDLHGFGPLLLAATAYYELARAAVWRARPAVGREFAAPDERAVRTYFDGVHAACEKRYNGDGSWGRGAADTPSGWFAHKNTGTPGDHPLIRTTGDCILGYLGAARGGGGKRPEGVGADKAPDERTQTYLARARAGLDWLVGQQEPDGCFRLYTRTAEGQVGHQGCLYVTGIAGTALLKGYTHFNDRAYLEASERAARWEESWPVSGNVNFNAFAVWHLAEHFQVTRGAWVLSAALRRVWRRILPRQQAAGGWPGHNSWIWYHSIILRGYGALCRVLPDGHPDKEELLAAGGAAVDYLARLQTETGALHPNPETCALAASPYSLAALPLWLACRPDRQAENVLRGMLAWRMNPASGDPDYSYNAEQKLGAPGAAPVNLYALGTCLENL